MREKITDIKQAISYFEYGVKCDIFQEPVTSYAKSAISALEKQIPKKPHEKKAGYKSFDYICPKCAYRQISKVNGEWIAGQNFNFCSNCGQALDWSDTE